jgi:hypothetical protein
VATNALDATGLSLGTLNELKRGFEEFHTKFAQGHCARASDEFWGAPGLDQQNKAHTHALHTI